MDPPIATVANQPWDTSVGNRLVHYTSQDHRAPLWIAALLALIYSIGILLVRIYIKRRVLGLDDYAISTSTLFAVGRFFVIHGGLKNGLGKSTKYVPDIQLVSRLVHSSQILSLVSLYLAKISLFLLIRRLFVKEQKILNLICCLAIVFAIISGLASMIISTTNCSPSTRFAEHCQSQNMRWIAITALDVATEIPVMLLPAYLVSQLQMKIGTKLHVITAFSFRLITVVFSVLQFDALRRYNSEPPSSLRIVPSLIWQEILLGTGLITATIPNMRAFVQSLSGNRFDAKVSSDMKSSKQFGNETFELKTMRTLKSTSSVIECRNLRLVPNPTVFKTQVDSSIEELEERGSLGSSGSQDMIIRKKTVWSVDRS